MDHFKCLLFLLKSTDVSLKIMKIFKVFAFKFIENFHFVLHVLHVDVLPVFTVNGAEQKEHGVHNELMSFLL